jgi:hypothetical protein
MKFQGTIKNMGEEKGEREREEKVIVRIWSKCVMHVCTNEGHYLCN